MAYSLQYEQTYNVQRSLRRGPAAGSRDPVDTNRSISRLLELMEPPNYRTVRFLAVCLLTLATLRQINAQSDPEWVKELKLGECI